jgi:hypothetical protein
MALAVETTGIRQPILRLVIGEQDPLEWDGFHGRFPAWTSASSLSPQRSGHGNQQQQTAHHGSASHRNLRLS